MARDMSTLSTHVLDTSLGKPAADLPVTLERLHDGQWISLGQNRTNADGRVKELLPAGAAMAPGLYRLSFDTAVYFATRSQRGFYPYVQVAFEIPEGDEHFHVPLLLSPYGYSTYRGS
jgi:5-hydroxyisourate hydrolase